MEIDRWKNGEEYNTVRKIEPSYDESKIPMPSAYKSTDEQNAYAEKLKQKQKRDQ